MPDLISTLYKAEKGFYQYVWPIFPLLFPPYLLQYAYIRFGIKHAENDRTLELGVGKVPYYKIYNKGDFVGVDAIHGNAKTVHILSKILRLKKNDHLDEHVVAVYRNLPFRSGIFDNIVSVWGCETETSFREVRENYEEISRVLKKEGTYLGFSNFRLHKNVRVFDEL